MSPRHAARATKADLLRANQPSILNERAVSDVQADWESTKIMGLFSTLLG